ncbi:MAG: hypothetical protein SGBAC_003131 [Bacillariaceae sp.]
MTMRSFGSFGIAIAIALMALMVNTVSGQACTVCGNAANVYSNPTAKYNGLTCSELQVGLEQLNNTEACETTINSDRYSWFEHESFCGCQGVTAPETCNICGDDELVAFPTNAVPWEFDDERYTCAEAVEFARHVSDPTVCSNQVATPAVKQACCRKQGEGCPTCTLGGGFKTNNRYRNITCDLIAEETFELDSVQCKAYYGRDTHYWLDWETFCGCDGALVPDKPCTLCGSFSEVVNPEAIAPWVNETDVYTCAEAHALALHISDNDVCVDEVQTPEVLAACCGPSTGGPAAAPAADSSAFTPATAVVSAGTGLMLAMLMLAM